MPPSHLSARLLHNRRHKAEKMDVENIQEALTGEMRRVFKVEPAFAEMENPLRVKVYIF